ncbi:MAG: hypothetical protein E6J85_21430 [Deltaproteobacteria bacterium]|nr:MAG: hypothetical protein E6J85_21430 [Deltaproteobacteria bacterium]
MKLSQIAAAAVVFLAGSASEAGQFANADSPDVLWRGDFEDGATSLSGHCVVGQNQWCGEQIVRSQQIQVVTDPVVEGRYAARFEVKYGDVYRTYSDERSILSPPTQMWEDEGNERWYRWQVLWPQDYVGSYPKWDELGTPASRSPAGSIVEWHHSASGGVESGSAPLYIRGGDKFIEMCLVDQKTSACRETINLTELLRGHWHDFVMHAKWSSDPSIGYLEMWIDGVNVLPKHMGSNKYPNMQNYMLIGLYRNLHIGDPNLLYPDGTHVYGTDGAPGVAYVDGVIPAPAPQPTTQAPPGGDTTPPTTTTPAPTAPAQTTPATTAGIGFPQGGGCSSTGFQSMWLALPLLGLFALRRRRLAA